MGPGKNERLLLLLYLIGLMYMWGRCDQSCDLGFGFNGTGCEDINECKDDENLCGKNAFCNNTDGSYKCICNDGFRNSQGRGDFKDGQGQCIDINECINTTERCQFGTCNNLHGKYWCECNAGYTNVSSPLGICKDIDECETNEKVCGEKGICNNIPGSYWCECPQGYTTCGKKRMPCSDIDECKTNEKVCGEKGTCNNTQGSYWCECPPGYTTYGKERMPCSELNCDSYSAHGSSAKSLAGLADFMSMMRNSCVALTDPRSARGKRADGDTLLENLFTAADAIMSHGSLHSREDVSALLHMVENSIRLIGPQLKGNGTRQSSHETEVEIAIHRGMNRPTGPVHLSTEDATLESDWETASGMGTYPGFAMAALVSYNNLTISSEGLYEELKDLDKTRTNDTYSISSRVVTVLVSNPSTEHLSRPVKITFQHLEDREESDERRYLCVYWNERGAWSTIGCQKSSNASQTVCTCEHLSSFAVLMAQYDMDHPFALILLTQIGLIISILCLILSILTFQFCRSIQGTRTVIHLHLCICLLMGDIIFLAGISRTEPVGGCKFVAAMLHYFFLAVFAWMLLEGVQLYRMVVLVFNATIRPLYLILTGYGMPLLIVILSAISRPSGYGTKKHCWLSLENGFTLSFFAPVCIIIILNIFFFIITVWKLAQKFTSLNPDLSQLHKIKAFTVTAIAQMCILGLMWVFGAFLFEASTLSTVAAYIFSILNSLQGALVFIMHCLLSKQVRDEYAHFLTCICTAHKKSYSDLSTSNPSSSQSQGSRSGQHTGESQT